MTLLKGFALVIALMAAVAVGILIGPRITHREGARNETSVAATPAPTATVEKEQPSRHVPRAAAARTSAKRDAATSAETVVSTKEPTPAGGTPRIVPAAAPALHERLKPLLNKGADMSLASQDFSDAKQFAATVHAARNTEVPFVLLKHRVLTERKSLEDAIHEFKPQLNAKAEAARAQEEAKSDISALVG